MYSEKQNYHSADRTSRRNGLLSDSTSKVLTLFIVPRVLSSSDICSHTSVTTVLNLVQESPSGSGASFLVQNPSKWSLFLKLILILSYIAFAILLVELL